MTKRRSIRDAFRAVVERHGGRLDVIDELIEGDRRTEQSRQGMQLAREAMGRLEAAANTWCGAYDAGDLASLQITAEIIAETVQEIREALELAAGTQPKPKDPRE